MLSFLQCLFVSPLKKHQVPKCQEWTPSSEAVDQGFHRPLKQFCSLPLVLLTSSKSHSKTSLLKTLCTCTVKQTRRSRTCADFKISVLLPSFHSVRMYYASYVNRKFNIHFIHLLILQATAITIQSRQVHWYNCGIDTTGVNDYFLIGLKVYFKPGSDIRFRNLRLDGPQIIGKAQYNYSPN